MKNAGKKLIIEMTNLIEELKRQDNLSAATAMTISKLREKLLTGVIDDPSKVPSRAELFKVYIDYCDKAEVIYKKTERICQLIITNSWVLMIDLYNNNALVDDTVTKCNEILQAISERRSNELEMRKWIVQMEMKMMAFM